MKIIILGAAGFIGTNLALQLAKEPDNIVTLVGRKIEHFEDIKAWDYKNVLIKIVKSYEGMPMDKLLENQDIVYHLVSTTIPSTSNMHIYQEMQSNINFSVKLFECCVRQEIKKVVFLSSGGTVYGRENKFPLCEDTLTNPITAYGVQKISIEKILYLYHYMYGMDYRIIRLSNPYGPYQRPNGELGAVTTFTYKALRGDKILVYGDGSVIRDFVFIDDAIRAMLNIVDGDSKYHLFNVGSGSGISIQGVLSAIKEVLGCRLNIEYIAGRKVDVPVNYLDVSRYESCFGKLKNISLEEGIRITAEFMKTKYKL